MIPSYQEEIRIRKSKDRIFWLIVAVITVFLYFFFQGYYPNYERFLDRSDVSKEAFLKPFGIIDIHVFPSPDGIWINNEYYNNNSKTIFDLGGYSVSIQKKGYLSVNFLIDITKKSPFYTNVVNLFALPEYVPLPLNFDSLSVYNQQFLLHASGTGGFLLTDSDFNVIHRIPTVYRHIGGLYFTDGKNIFSYSLDTDKFLSVIDPKTWLSLQCADISYYGEKLFCHDTLSFVGPKVSDIREKILAINENLAVTSRYFYNQDTTNTSWKYFEYATGSLHFPETVVHIKKIPYFLEKGVLTPLDEETRTAPVPKRIDWGLSDIASAHEFDGETLLLGQKDGRKGFRIIDAEKQYAGIFDIDPTSPVKAYKISGTYVFTTPESAYVYYKWAKEIAKILDGVTIVWVVDADIFFNKDGKSYSIDLLRKPLK